MGRYETGKNKYIIVLLISCVGAALSVRAGGRAASVYMFRAI